MALSICYVVLLVASLQFAAHVHAGRLHLQEVGEDDNVEFESVDVSSNDNDLLDEESIYGKAGEKNRWRQTYTLQTCI